LWATFTNRPDNLEINSEAIAKIEGGLNLGCERWERAKMRKWETIFSEAERALAKKAGIGMRQSFGKRPALIIIDVNNAFIGSVPKPVLESVEEYYTSCGEKGWAALEHIQKLLLACRSKHVPVIYTTNDAVTRQFCWGPAKSAAPLKTLDLKGQEIAEMIKPLPSELVVRKTKASAFFGTPLREVLHDLNVDSLFVCGTTTSGCVRATIVDAFSCGLRCFLVEEGTFDRFELSHLVNLWDINAKYADVITVDEALGYIDGLS
jgi:maleamate amidohydrolase